MEMAGASSPQVLRKLNARRVLEHAWRADAFTASDVMTATGLTRSTVIGVCDELDVITRWHVESLDRRIRREWRRGARDPLQLGRPWAIGRRALKPVSGDGSHRQRGPTDATSMERVRAQTRDVPPRGLRHRTPPRSTPSVPTQSVS